jgi:hypothetical protein
MSKKQNTGGGPIEAHIRAPIKLLDSPAWCALSSTAKALWVDLRRQVGATKNGTVTTALDILKHRGWSSRHTVQHAAEELEALGFISCTVDGGIANGGKTLKRWAFTDLETYEQPKYRLPAKKVTSDFLLFESLGHARAELKKLEAKRADAKNNRKVQKLHLAGAQTAPESPKLSAETAHETPRKVQKLHTRKGSRNRLETRAETRSRPSSEYISSAPAPCAETAQINRLARGSTEKAGAHTAEEQAAEVSV